MADIPAIPSKINNYNVYNVAERLIGVGDEVTLPDFEAMADTISGAGILGEVDDPTVGHFSNMEMEIPFRLVDHEAADMMDMICIVFVRGKKPDGAILQLAVDRGIAVLATKLPMFAACGLLYEKGLRGGMA